VFLWFWSYQGLGFRDWMFWRFLNFAKAAKQAARATNAH